MNEGGLTGKNLRSYAGVILTTLMWATSGIFIKLVLRSSGMGEFTLAFWRDLCAFCILFFGCLIFNRPLLRIDPRDLPWVAGVGCIGLGVFHLLWNFGINLNGVAVSTVQQAVMPVILLLLARLFFAERLSFTKGTAIFLSLCGTVLVSGIADRSRTGGGIGALLIGCAIPFTYAAFNLFGKRVSGKYRAVTILTYGFGFAALILLPLQFFPSLNPQPLWGGAPGIQHLWLAGLVIVSTLLPFLLYTSILRHLQVGVAGILAMAEIPIAFFYARLLFGETFSPFQWAGTGCVAAGLGLLIGLSGRRRKTDIPPV